jgi:hypothetical protein
MGHEIARAWMKENLMSIEGRVALNTLISRDAILIRKGNLGTKMVRLRSRRGSNQ